MLRILAILCELAKVRVTASVTLSAAAGHILFAQTISTELVLPLLGVFLLAAGSSALNQVQEARLDRLMERTRKRPIPSGRVDPAWALFAALALLSAGFYTLALIENHTLLVLGLGAFTVLWYNGVYTYLKRITAFAVVPGALVGALPPAIGWASAGGMPSDPAIAQLAFFLALWQIPHFWLLQLLLAADYERAGLPTLARRFTPRQLGRLDFMWLAAVAAAALLAGVEARLRLPWNALLLLASVVLVRQAVYGLTGAAARPGWPRRAFLVLNLYGLAFLVALAGDALTRR